MNITNGTRKNTLMRLNVDTSCGLFVSFCVGLTALRRLSPLYGQQSGKYGIQIIGLYYMVRGEIWQTTFPEVLMIVSLSVPREH